MIFLLMFIFAAKHVTGVVCHSLSDLKFANLSYDFLSCIDHIKAEANTKKALTPFRPE